MYQNLVMYQNQIPVQVPISTISDLVWFVFQWLILYCRTEKMTYSDCRMLGQQITGRWINSVECKSGPAPRGHSPAAPPPNDCLCPPNENCAPPSEDCARKKLTGSGLMECKSRPKTPKLVFTARIFVIFVDAHRIS